jgi:hypothetical protein
MCNCLHDNFLCHSKKRIKKDGKMDIIGGYGMNMFVMFNMLYMLNTQFITLKQYSIVVFIVFFLQGIQVVLLEIQARKKQK